MARLFNALAALAAVAAGTARGEELGQIRGRISIPQKFAQGLPADQGLIAAKVIVDGGLHMALPTSDGYFSISGVPAGPHYLQVVHPMLVFDPVRVEAPEAAGGKTTAYIADLEYGRGSKLKYPLGLAPVGAYKYFEERQEFNLWSIVKNPPMLIGLFSCGVMFLMPKLQPMLEEEKRLRMEQEAMREGGAGAVRDRQQARPQ
mmetsp:Transcript_77536/g.217389  ORF Transcript_77536/g.217389 Transcript_77536/m.217389 type:complete len:203 (+) Transcript_77536:70-678(+)